MGVSSKRAFLARKMARHGSLGLHLMLCLAASIVFVGAFLALGTQVRGTEPPAVDRRLFESLREHREAHPALSRMFAGITELGGNRVGTVLVALVAGVLLGQKRWALAAVSVAIIVAGIVMNDEIKLVYMRHRPPLSDAHIHEGSYSFPSGHSMNSMIGYGFLGYLIALALPPSWRRRAALAGIMLIIVAIGFSRMYLSAHWLTDVLGGFALGAAWLALCVALLESCRLYSAARQKRGAYNMEDPISLVQSEELP